MGAPQIQSFFSHPILLLPQSPKEIFLGESGGYDNKSAKNLKINRIFMLDQLAVITPYFNPQRWKSRPRLYHEFAAYMERCQVPLFTIELGFNNRSFEVTSAQNPTHIQLRTQVELWHKERMINLAIQRLPEKYKYIAWIDADIQFARTDWASETVQLLQHFQVIQMFADAVDLDPNHNHHRLNEGFIKRWINSGRPNHNQLDEMVKKKIIPHPSSYCGMAGPTFAKSGPISGHPGFAWAARRKSLDQLGGLIDAAILGSSDRHMACALLGCVELSHHALISDGYKNALSKWQEKANRYIRGNVGFMPGLLLHGWHGRKVDRKYQDRWKILVDHEFDPNIHLNVDSQGLWKYADLPEASQLFYRIRDYFNERNEDSIDV